MQASREGVTSYRVSPSETSWRLGVPAVGSSTSTNDGSHKLVRAAAAMVVVFVVVATVRGYSTRSSSSSSNNLCRIMVRSSSKKPEATKA